MAQRPRDPSQLAKLIVDMAIGEADDPVSPAKRSPSNRKAGGRRGGAARAEQLTPEQRQDIAKLAARARWKNSPAKYIGADMKVVSGNPDPKHISTSFVERQNLTMRWVCAASHA